MAFPLLGLLTSPIAKIGLGVVTKVVDGVKHKQELKNIQKNAEIAARQSIDYAEVEKAKQIALAKAQVAKAEAGVRKSQVADLDKTWRDEILTITLCGLIVANFLPFTAPHMERGWQLVSTMPDFIQWSFLAVIGGTFGINMTSKIKKK